MATISIAMATVIIAMVTVSIVMLILLHCIFTSGFALFTRSATAPSLPIVYVSNPATGSSLCRAAVP